MKHVWKVRSALAVAARLSLFSAVAVATSLSLFSAPAFADPPLDMAHQFVAGDEITVSGECPTDGSSTVVLYFDGDEISRQEKAEDTPAFTISGTFPDDDTRMPEDVASLVPHVLSATCGSRQLPPFGIEVVEG